MTTNTVLGWFKQVKGPDGAVILAVNEFAAYDLASRQEIIADTNKVGKYFSPPAPERPWPGRHENQIPVHDDRRRIFVAI